VGRTTLTVLLGQDAAWLREALEQLADSVIDDSEAGQRGTKVSVFIRTIASAYIINPDETTRLLREVKALT
jgi:hypothetical protein